MTGFPTTMQPRLSDPLLAKASQWRKSASAPTRVKLILKDGRTVYEVFVSEGGEIAKAGGRRVFDDRDLRFKAADIVEVLAY